ncbi:MAG: caspase family protein [Planctomycetota bacterium]
MLALAIVIIGGPARSEKAIAVEESVEAHEYIGANRYLLAIGINDFVDPEIPDLETCEADAEAIYELLTHSEIGAVPRENATLLLGAQATYRRIKTALVNLDRVPADSTVFIYFSSHGTKERGEAFWVTQDTELKTVAATALSNTEINQRLSRIQAKRKVVMIDACYAAATVQGQKAIIDVAGILESYGGAGHATLSAAGPDETALEARDLDHSVFTYHLLAGLRGKADDPEGDGDGDGVVTLPELSQYLDQRVKVEARQRGGQQEFRIDMAGVRDGDRFLLTVAPDRLRRRVATEAQQTERLARIKASIVALVADGVMSPSSAAIADRVLDTPDSEQTVADRELLERLFEFEAGEIAPDKLQAWIEIWQVRHAPDAVESTRPRPMSPDQRAFESLRLRVANGLGDSDDEFRLGNMYHIGDGVKRDAAAAVRHFEQAARDGHVKAMVNYGVALERGTTGRSNAAAAAEWYRRSAERGFAPAMYNLALCLAEGRGVAKQEAEALAWMDRARRSGDTEAMFVYAVWLDKGIGQASDFDAAIRAMREAADRGHTNANAWMGYKIYTNKPSNYSRRDMRRYLDTAAKQGHQGAKKLLQQLGLD